MDQKDPFDSDAPADSELEYQLLDSEQTEPAVVSQDQASPYVGETTLATTGVGTPTDDFATEEFTDTHGDLYGQTEVISAEPMRAVPEESTPPPAKPKSRKPVLVVLLLFILAVAVLIIPQAIGVKIPFISDIKIPYLSDLDFKIPYVSDLFQSKVQDVAGNLKMAPLDKTISGKFIQNFQAGPLFVIRGKVKNEYDHPRSLIKVTAKLYQKGKKLAKTATVYCGNTLSDADLAKMNLAAINKQLKNSMGKNRINFKVKTGRSVPFMIVFDSLPNNLDEYTVEVAGSSL